MSDEIQNPFPKRGIARRNTYYNDYWKNKYNNFEEFMNKNNLNKKTSQFLTVAGDLGGGKTATLYHMENEIKKKRKDVLILYWQLSKTADYTLQQSFYLGFINALKKARADQKVIDLINKGANPELFKKYNIIRGKLQPGEYNRLSILMEEHIQYKRRFTPDNTKIISLISEKSEEIKNFLEIKTEIEFTHTDINKLEEIMHSKDINYASLLEAKLDHGTIITQFNEILKELEDEYTCIVLLIDEFDTLIRSYGEDIPNSVFNELSTFIVWLDPEDFLGYHIVGSMTLENHDRLVRAFDGKKDPSTFRRLNNYIKLETIKDYSYFYKHIYLNYLRKARIDENFKLFDDNFLYLIFKAGKNKFGFILLYLWDQFNAWKEEISENYALFKKNQTQNDIGLYDLIWNPKGLSKFFDDSFKDFILNSDHPKDYQRILLYLLGIKKKEICDENAPSYEKISSDIGVGETIITLFHGELDGIQLYQNVFPKTSYDTFYIDYEFIPVLFDISTTEAELPPPTIIIEDNVDKKGILFQEFIKFFSLKKNLKYDEKDWNFFVNEGFRYLMNDYLRCGPMENIFLKYKVRVEPYLMTEFLKKYGSDQLVKSCNKLELEMKSMIHNDFEIYMSTIEIIEEKNDILSQQFLIVFLPIKPRQKIAINMDFINFFVNLIEKVKINKFSFSSIIIFIDYKVDYKEFNYMASKIKNNTPWVHLIDQIIPLKVSTGTQITVKGEKAVSFLTRKSVFEYFCGAFYKLHKEAPPLETETYFQLLFKPENENAQFNENNMFNVLNHIFQKYPAILQTFSHDLISAEQKKRDGEPIKPVKITYFPKFLKNLFTLFEYDFPVATNGLIFRQLLGEPFQIGTYTKQKLLSCLDELIKLPVLEVTHKDTRDDVKMSVLKTLIEANLINFNIDKDGIKLSIRTDINSLLKKIEKIVEDNIKENDKFSVLQLKLKTCNLRSTASIPTVEYLLDLLKKNRKIFDYYPELEIEKETEEQADLI